MGLIAYVDGGSRGNPGPAGAGVAITHDDGTLLHEGAYYLGRQTNNAAEYHALIRALQRIEHCHEKNVTVCSDSELLVRQITGEYRVKSPRLAQLFQQAQLLLLRIPCWSIRHVPREENLRADELANLAMDQQRDVIVFDADHQACAGTPTQAEPPAAADDDLAVVDPDPPGVATEQSEVSGERPQTAHAARITLVRPPVPEGCPAGPCTWKSVTVQATLPAGLCVHAAHALMPTILAILNTEPAEFAAVPTLTVRCMRAECGATFHVSPLRGANGAAKRDGPS